MRVLWFTNTPSLYQQNFNIYNGGGWIESLEQNIKKNSEINLAISFFYTDSPFKVEERDVTYYPIFEKRSIVKKFLHRLYPHQRIDDNIQHFLRVINDFKPDVIHVFGSEESFGLIAKYVDIPVVLHLQGVLTPCLNAWYPPGYSSKDMYSLLSYNPFKIYRYSRNYRYFFNKSKQELSRFSSVRYYMGRTEWDRQITSIFSPNSKYFYCNEILRAPFYRNTSWKPHLRNKIKLVTTISSPLYKGYDLVLKTAALLHSLNLFSFKWYVFGNIDTKLTERKLRTKAADVHVKMGGVISAELLAEELLSSDIFIHPSYIDNSPNSICEAQILGVPVISTNVGGIASLIEQNKTGVLIPANDPYTLCAKIIEIYKNKDFAKHLGKTARICALKRHNIEDIVDQNISIYKSILSEDH